MAGDDTSAFETQTAAPARRLGLKLRLCFTFVVTSLKKLFTGGSDGNEQLTAIVGTLLLVVLAIEGATLVNLRSLLTVHAFIGMLLIPIVTRVVNLLPILRRRLAGTGLRLGLVGATLGAGLLLGALTLPAADHLQDNVSGSVGVDTR
jgi:hypothetical protein